MVQNLPVSGQNLAVVAAVITLVAREAGQTATPRLAVRPERVFMLVDALTYLALETTVT